MRRLLYISLAALTCCGMLTALVIFGLYRAASYEPEFYAQALRIEQESHQLAGEQLEQSVLELHNDTQQEGGWEAVFSDGQINGWLASDLPEKFPNLLPAEIEEPRISIEPEFVRLACRVKTNSFATVVSFALGIRLTEEPNTLAFKVCDVRAGALPVPFKQFLERVTAAAEGSDLTVRWSHTEGDPVALVSVPVVLEEYPDRQILVESIEMRDGEIYLAGRTLMPENESLAQAPESASSNRTRHR